MYRWRMRRRYLRPKREVGQMRAYQTLVIASLVALTTACSTPPAATEAPEANSHTLLGPGNPTNPAPQPVSEAMRCKARHVNVDDPQAWLPDPACTPGATDGGLPAGSLCPFPDTDPVRPPNSYTDHLKTAQMRAYGWPGPSNAYEEDHLVPLVLGGSPRNPANLWPQPGRAPNRKDTVEVAAHRAVCGRRLDLGVAQRRIALDWYALGQDLGAIR